MPRGFVAAAGFLGEGANGQLGSDAWVEARGEGAAGALTSLLCPPFFVFMPPLAGLCCYGLAIFTSADILALLCGADCWLRALPQQLAPQYCRHFDTGSRAQSSSYIMGNKAMVKQRVQLITELLTIVEHSRM